MRPQFGIMTWNNENMEGKEDHGISINSFMTPN